MATEFQEPEEKIKSDIPEEVNILTDEPIKERPHTQKAETGTIPIEEWTPPPFTGQPGDEQEDGTSGPNDQAPYNPQKEKPHEFANEGLKDLPPQQKLEGSRMLSKTIVDGVDAGVTALGNHLIKIPDKKFNQLVKDGEINPNLQTSYKSNPCTVEGAKEIYNEKAHNAISLSDEYKEVATEFLAEELAKRDIGLTKGQQFGLASAMELIRLGKITIEMRSTAMELLEGMKDISAGMANYAPPPPQPVHAHSPAPPADTVSVVLPSTEFTDTPPPMPQQTEVFFDDPAAIRTAAVASAVDDIQMGRGQGGIIPQDTNIYKVKKIRKPGSSIKKATTKKKKTTNA